MKPFVRSATFVDNQSLLLKDGDRNLWRFDLLSGRTELACEGEAVLAPIARAFPDKPRLARACAGTYPQVASAAHGLRVVVNPSDTATAADTVLFYLSRLPSNPYPGAQCTAPRRGVLWQIEI